jgi:hypothetical protein
MLLLDYHTIGHTYWTPASPFGPELRSQDVDQFLGTNFKKSQQMGTHLSVSWMDSDRSTENSGAPRCRKGRFLVIVSRHGKIPELLIPQKM